MLLLIGAFLVLMLIGAPVAVAMATASLLYLVFYGVAPDIIADRRKTHNDPRSASPGPRYPLPHGEPRRPLVRVLVLAVATGRRRTAPLGARHARGLARSLGAGRPRG